MSGQLLKAEATLLPAAGHPRMIPGWRPAVAPFDMSRVDTSAPALGIAFTKGPGSAQVGVPFECIFQCLAWPDPRCDHLRVGTEFAFLEGSTVVGHGRIIGSGQSGGA